MSLLSRILQDEHKTLLTLFAQLQRADMRSEEGKALLTKTKFLLNEHLKKEDEYLYPELKKLDETILLANNFSSEMKGLTAKVDTFFKTYEKGGPGMNFSKELGELAAALKVRIIREDKTLFPQYDKLVD